MQCAAAAGRIRHQVRGQRPGEVPATACRQLPQVIQIPGMQDRGLCRIAAQQQCPAIKAARKAGLQSERAVVQCTQIRPGHHHQLGTERCGEIRNVLPLRRQLHQQPAGTLDEHRIVPCGQFADPLHMVVQTRQG